MNLGRIEAQDVRKVWTKEAAEFTPWLAQDENIAMLGDAIGLELEVENIEVAVGPYSADILAKDTGSGRYVVIENQLGKTNHDHLGKAIMYGAVLDAGAVVWIAINFTDEHQKALDWLNANTGEDVSFYGVQVELWTIDKSRPAVRFNVVSKPAEITKQAAAAKTSDPLTETKRVQLAFWTRVRDRLIEKKVVPKAHTPRPRYWFNVPLGSSVIWLSNIANTTENRVGVRIYLRHTVADKALMQLEAQKDAIERDLGEKLVWNPSPNKRDKTIALFHKADLWKPKQFAEAAEWLVAQVAKFREVLMPIVKRMDLSPQSTSQPEADREA
jgi:hypothetical protein